MIEPKVTSKFEEATRCQECLSDRIYAYQDTDGGMCLACGVQVTERIIKGGISYIETTLQQKLVDSDWVKGKKKILVANELDKQEEQKEKIAKDVAKLKTDIGALNKSSVTLPPIKEAPKGPSMAQKAKDWLLGLGKAKEPAKPTEKPKKPEMVTTTTSPDNGSEVGLPKVGERWFIGPCRQCGINRKLGGTVVASKATRTSSRFIEVSVDGEGTRWYGCFFCAKKG